MTYSASGDRRVGLKPSFSAKRPILRTARGARFQHQPQYDVVSGFSPTTSKVENGITYFLGWIGEPITGNVFLQWVRDSNLTETFENATQ